MKNSRPSRKPNLGMFHVSCWVLGLAAFLQLMSVGVALAFQNQRTPEPEERIVKEYVVVPAARTAPVTVAPQKPKPIAVVPPTSLPELKKVLPDLESVARFAEEDVLSLPPPVLDPVVEALLKEARKARVGGDVLLSLTKLQEAELREPRDPNVLYGLGSTYEAFGIFDKARDYYYGVFKLGPDAGSLFEKASFKVAQGLVPDVKDLARLGWGRMTNPSQEANGERRTLILPVEVDTSKDFDPMLFTPRVRFYEDVDGQIGQAIIQQGDSGSEWVTGVADWKDGEEIAEVWYFVPDQDPATGLLFGQRKFYGFVAELYYDGRLIDIRAQPRTLLREGSGESTMEELQRELDNLDGLDLEDLSEGDSLLPKLNLPFPAPEEEPEPKPELPDEGN
ncbi:hypothetical protein N9A70_03130 [Akkermansiaceae bacterium]|nr:hypothetical protein [Akkermansiaceae bacterium]MDB4792920.1 hypothetical protein [bacterium]MDA7891410.1 hypothetical protein [Akkermansiaceae bacterium]MDA7934117.1 hypothetical protein [Akkermansiaceae bacterium]MDB4383592.1 hypothetical protein [Akkermansiaceae bacterium]